MPQLQMQEKREKKNAAWWKETNEAFDWVSGRGKAVLCECIQAGV